MSLRGALMLAGIVLIVAFPFAGLHLAVLGLAFIAASLWSDNNE